MRPLPLGASELANDAPFARLTESRLPCSSDGRAAMDERAKLLLLGDVAGAVFGTEDFSLFLYSLVRMQAPVAIVELGTGLGASAFWMALAAKQNGVGHVWTVDDLNQFERYDGLLGKTIAHLRGIGFGPLEATTPGQYFDEVSNLLGLRSQISFVKEKIELEERLHFDRYPFANERIDLLFSDFKHGPDDVLSILGHFLPRMSAASSIFIDSAPTAWPSYLLLEQVVSHLNGGHIPAALQDRTAIDLGPVMRNRRIVLVHVTEKDRKRAQNSTAWLKIEPIDVVPQPRASMRGV